MVRSEFQFEMTFLAVVQMVSWSIDLLETPARSGNIDMVFIDCHGGLEMNRIGSLLSASSGRNLPLSSFPFLTHLLRVFFGGIAEVSAIWRGWSGGRRLASSIDFRVLRWICVS